MPLVYYIEDDQAISHIIEKTIENAGLKGKGFSTGEAFMSVFREQRPDFICLDIMLPDVSGIDLLKLIRKVDRDVPIMMVSALQSEMDKVIALDAGADDYLTKPFGVLELTSRIKAKLRKTQGPMVFHVKNVFMDDKKHQVKINDKAIYFTQKEYDILKLLLKNEQEIATREAIFRSVWDTDFIGETRTLDMHIKSLRKKLAENDAEIAIKTVRGVGYHLL